MWNMMGQGFAESISLGKVLITAFFLTVVVGFLLGFACGYGCHMANVKYHIKIEKTQEARP